MWSTRNYKCLRVLEGHDSRVSGIDFMADKVGVVSCSHDKTTNDCCLYGLTLSCLSRRMKLPHQDPNKHIRL